MSDPTLAEVGRALDRIDDAIAGLRTDLVCTAVCDGRHRYDSLRLDNVEKAIVEVRADMEARSSSRTQALVAIAVGVLALLGSVGAALISLLN